MDRQGWIRRRSAAMSPGLHKLQAEVDQDIAVDQDPGHDSDDVERRCDPTDHKLSRGPIVRDIMASDADRSYDEGHSISPSPASDGVPRVLRGRDAQFALPLKSEPGQVRPNGARRSRATLLPCCPLLGPDSLQTALSHACGRAGVARLGFCFPHAIQHDADGLA